MKPKLILLAVLAMLYISCMKQYDLQAVKNDLTGMWVSKDPMMTLSIENTMGYGATVKYYDIKRDGQRYLRIEAPDSDETYKITYLKNDDMYLLDANNKLMIFNRVRK